MPGDGGERGRARGGGGGRGGGKGDPSCPPYRGEVGHRGGSAGLRLSRSRLIMHSVQSDKLSSDDAIMEV